MSDRYNQYNRMLNKHPNLRYPVSDEDYDADSDSDSMQGGFLGALSGALALAELAKIGVPLVKDAIGAGEGGIYEGGMDAEGVMDDGIYGAGERKIFNRFRKLGETARNMQGGTGLYGAQLPAYGVDPFKKTKTIGGAKDAKGAKIDKRKIRGQLLSKIMKETGMKLGEASKYIKENNLVELAAADAVADAAAEAASEAASNATDKPAKPVEPESETLFEMHGGASLEENPIVKAQGILQQASIIQKWELASPDPLAKQAGVRKMRDLLNKIKGIKAEYDKILETERNTENVIGIRRAIAIYNQILNQYSYLMM